MRRTLLHILVLLVTLTTAVPAGAAGGWTFQTSGTGFHLEDAVALDANTVVAVGHNGVIRRTTNGGATWVGVGGQTAEALHAIARSGPILVAVGTDAATLRSLDGGLTWSVVASGTQAMNGVAANGPVVVAVGNSGTIRRSTDGGMTWSVARPATSPSENLYGVAHITASTFVAVGWGGLILRSTDDGVTWTPRPSGVTAKLNGVAHYGADDALAVGYGGTILLSEDGGQSWTRQSSGVTVELNDAWAFDDRPAYVVGDSGMILKSTDRATWFVQPSGLPLTHALRGVVGASDDAVWAFGSLGQILATTDGGGGAAPPPPPTNTPTPTFTPTPMPAGVNFSIPVVHPNPALRYVSCNVGIFQEPERLHKWSLLYRGVGTFDVPLELIASSVNPAERGAIRATVTDDAGLKQVDVVHPAVGENTGLLSLRVTGGRVYSLLLERLPGGTGLDAHHYRLGSADRQLEMGWRDPLQHLEGVPQVWLFNTAPNEGYRIDLWADPSTFAHPATRIDYTVDGVPDSAALPFSLTAPGAGWPGKQVVLKIDNADGHFRMKKATGADTGFYLAPCPDEKPPSHPTATPTVTPTSTATSTAVPPTPTAPPTFTPSTTPTATPTNTPVPPAISIAGEGIEEGSSGMSPPRPLRFTVSLSRPSSSTVAVAYTTAGASAEPGSDYVPTSGTLAFAPGETEQTITVLVIGDLTYEPDEQVGVELSAATDATIAGSSALGEIRNDDDAPRLYVADASAVEGHAGVTTMSFTVSLERASGVTGRVEVGLYPVSANPSDYVDWAGQELVFAPGETTKTVTVDVRGDTDDEHDETFWVSASRLENVGVGDVAGTGTIVDDDVTPVMSIGSATVVEGDAGPVAMSFTVTLSEPSSATASAEFETFVDSAVGSDFEHVRGEVSFAPGETTRTITVYALGDTDDESNESFWMGLRRADRATLGDATAVGTIVDDDVTPAVVLDASAYSVVEGHAGQRTVTVGVSLSEPSSATATVRYSASAWSANGGDFDEKSGEIVFPPGTTSSAVEIAVYGDTDDEADEEIFFYLRGPTDRATLGTPSSAWITIVDDDVTPEVSISDASVQEGDSGTTPARFTVTLSEPSSATGTVYYHLADFTTNGADRIDPGWNVLELAPGETSKEIVVEIVGDTTRESDEQFVIYLSSPSRLALGDETGLGTVVDDDGFRLGDFVALARGGLLMGRESRATSGDVGAGEARARPGAAGGRSGPVEVRLEPGAAVLGPGSRVVGDTVRLGRGAQVGELHANELVDQGASIGSRAEGVLELPLVDLPAAPSVEPGAADVDVPRGATSTLPPGAYRDLRVGAGATLLLTGGTYHLRGVELDARARVRFAGSTRLLIQSRLRADADVDVAGQDGASASQLIVYAAAGDASAEHASVRVGRGGQLQGTLYAPNGTIDLGRDVRLTGAAVAERVVIGDGARLDAASAFASGGATGQ